MPKIINKIQNGLGMLLRIRARNLLPNNIKRSRFIQLKRTKHLEVYKDLGEKTLGEYNESFLNFKMSLK